jgi:hypothetical protein
MSRIRVGKAVLESEGKTRDVRPLPGLPAFSRWPRKPHENWRRRLWEEIYPRIRHESSPEDAARIVVRHLRERVSIASLPNFARTVPEIFRKQITDPAGFEMIYVAALRAVGIPARLDDQKKAEFWNGTDWQIAPNPASF